MKVPVERGRPCENLSILCVVVLTLILIPGLGVIQATGSIESLRDAGWVVAIFVLGIGHFVADGLAHRDRKRP